MAGNALPILLLGGAAALMLAGKKKKTGRTWEYEGPPLPPTTPPPPQSKPEAEPSPKTTYVPMELAYLGYQIAGGKKTIEAFQGDYNVVMMMQTGRPKHLGSS